MRNHGELPFPGQIRRLATCAGFTGLLLALMFLGAPTFAATPDAATSVTAHSEDTGQATETDEASQEVEKQRYRLLPIPILITEPAIGEGLGVTLALFHPVKPGKQDSTRVATPGSITAMSGGREAPPVVTALAAAYTTNDTWFAGLGHFNNWRRDSIRYAGALALARVNSTIYLLNRPIGFSMETDMVFQELKFRLGNSDWLLGAGVFYLDAKNRFGTNLPGIGEDDRFGLTFKNVGAAAELLYETRDNTMNPTSGQLFELSLWRYDEAISGSFDYWSWKLKALSFHPLTPKVTLGLRAELTGVDGRPPFFGYPWVSLRGIPALRYQDNQAGAAEIEGRYLLAPRWEISAFAGLGYTSNDNPLFVNPGSINNFGLGSRYKVFEAHNVWMGIDIARGPEDWNWYIQIGQAW